MNLSVWTDFLISCKKNVNFDYQTIYFERQNNYNTFVECFEYQSK